MQDDIVSGIILGFAGLLAAGRTDETGRDYAAHRGWIDPEGRPTPDGRALFSALIEQRQTRSTLRLAI